MTETQPWVSVLGAEGGVFITELSINRGLTEQRVGYTLLFIAFHSLWMLIVPRTFRARWQQERRNWGKSKDRQKKLKAIWGKLLSKSLKWGFVLFCSILCHHWWLLSELSFAFCSGRLIEAKSLTSQKHLSRVYCCRERRERKKKTTLIKFSFAFWFTIFNNFFVPFRQRIHWRRKCWI